MEDSMSYGSRRMSALELLLSAIGIALAAWLLTEAYLAITVVLGERPAPEQTTSLSEDYELHAP